jgi:hypothetical protein
MGEVTAQYLKKNICLVAKYFLFQRILGIKTINIIWKRVDLFKKIWQMLLTFFKSLCYKSFKKLSFLTLYCKYSKYMLEYWNTNNVIPNLRHSFEKLNNNNLGYWRWNTVKNSPVYDTVKNSPIKANNNQIEYKNTVKTVLTVKKKKTHRSRLVATSLNIRTL